MARSYKIRNSVAGPGQRKVYRLTVPPDIAEALPADVEFEPELTEEGLLYRPVDARAAKPDLPSWAKKPAKR